MYQCPHLTSWRAKTQTEQELSWMLVCVCMGASGCMHSPTFVCMCVCAWEWGVHSQFLVMCVCLRLCLLFRDAAVLWSKGEAQREKGEKKGAKLLFSKDSCLLVRDTALIRCAVAVDKHDHRGASVNSFSNWPMGKWKRVQSVERKFVLPCWSKKFSRNRDFRLLRKDITTLQVSQLAEKMCMIITTSLLLISVTTARCK